MFNVSGWRSCSRDNTTITGQRLLGHHLMKIGQKNPKKLERNLKELKKRKSEFYWKMSERKKDYLREKKEPKGARISQGSYYSPARVFCAMLLAPHN